MTFDALTASVKIQSTPNPESNLGRITILEERLDLTDREALIADGYAVVGALLTTIGSLIITFAT